MRKGPRLRTRSLSSGEKGPALGAAADRVNVGMITNVRARDTGDHSAALEHRDLASRESDGVDVAAIHRNVKAMVDMLPLISIFRSAFNMAGSAGM